MLNLLDCNDSLSYTNEMDAIRKSYLTGVYTSNGNTTELPFGSLFQEHFEIRKDEELPLDDKNRKWQGNLNHFCNVVGATAHLLNYFEKHMESYLPEEADITRHFDDQRKLDNLLKSYYHDLGKTVIGRRHAVEGKAFFVGMKASARYLFRNFFALYPDCQVSSCTLSCYAEHIGAHDLFGTLGTGENGLFSLCGVLNGFADLYDGDTSKVKTAVFDLWLLNVADIITSITEISGTVNGEFQQKPINKFIPHDWVKYVPGTLETDIQLFLDSFHGKCLLDDLGFAMQIAGSENKEDIAKTLAEKRSAHRLQRLACQTLGGVLKQSTTFPVDLKSEILSRLTSDPLLAQIKIILKGEFGSDYGKLFGTMLQFDYALGFFQKISAQAVYWMEQELANKPIRTGFLYNQKDPKPDAVSSDNTFLTPYNAECAINCYIMVLAGIFGEIHRFTEDIERWNIEFDDAGNRLTKSKANRLIYIDGVYQAGKARVQLMRELMLYKS